MYLRYENLYGGIISPEITVFILSITLIYRTNANIYI